MSKRGRPRHPGRLEQDATIWLRLSQSDRGTPTGSGRVYIGDRELLPSKSVSEAAKELSREWAAQGYHEDWTSIRTRYNKLKKLHTDPDAVKGSF